MALRRLDFQIRVQERTQRIWAAQETSTPNEAWAALVEAFQLFLLGTGHPEQLPTSSSYTDAPAPISPSSAKAYHSNGPAALDQHHLISGDSRNSLQAAPHLAATLHAAPSDAESDDGLLESMSQADAELEAAVLDTLTENVLVSCAKMPSESRSAVTSLQGDTPCTVNSSSILITRTASYCQAGVHDACFIQDIQPVCFMQGI